VLIKSIAIVIAVFLAMNYPHVLLCGSIKLNSAIVIRSMLTADLQCVESAVKLQPTNQP